MNEPEKKKELGPKALGGRPPKTPRTKAELAFILSTVESMVLEGRRTSEIKRFCYNAKWTHSSQTVNVWIRRARDSIVKSIRQPKKLMVGQVNQNLDRCIADPHATWRDKLKALELKMKLFGLEAPKKITPTDIHGNPLTAKQRASHIEAIIQERFPNLEYSGPNGKNGSNGEDP